MIHIIDYGVGNIQAFMTSFKRIGLESVRACSAEQLKGATRLILPGVGAFDHAMQMLNNSGLRPSLESLVIEQKVPVLGVCVGMQMLASGSDEGVLSGLGWIPGRVRDFASKPESPSLPMPHMGWNDLQFRQGARLFSQGFEDGAQFYFLHSYYFDAEKKTHVVATAHYGFDFDAVVSHEHIHGVQYHPEKSHHWGAQLLKNFAEL
jgi:glutamine amidotransferase